NRVAGDGGEERAAAAALSEVDAGQVRVLPDLVAADAHVGDAATVGGDVDAVALRRAGIDHGGGADGVVRDRPIEPRRRGGAGEVGGDERGDRALDVVGGERVIRDRAAGRGERDARA